MSYSTVRLLRIVEHKLTKDLQRRVKHVCNIKDVLLHLEDLAERNSFLCDILISDLYLVRRANGGRGRTLWSGHGGAFWKRGERTSFNQHANRCSSGQTVRRAAVLPGLLSFSSLSSRPPDTPLSLDWSCTFIFSLLLILHTALLERGQTPGMRGLNGWDKGRLVSLRSLHATVYVAVIYEYLIDWCMNESLNQDIG